MNYFNLARWYEKNEAKDYNGKTQAGSGNTWSAKSDIKTSIFLIEVKFTTKDQYTLKYEDLEKCFEYAYREGRIPVFQIGFYGGQEFVIIDEATGADSIHITTELGEIEIKPGAKSKSLNKYILLNKPEIKKMIYNKLRLFIMPKKKFKEIINE